MTRPALAVIDTDPQPTPCSCGGVTTLLRIEQAAQVLGVSRAQLYEFIAAGVLRAVTLPTGRGAAGGRSRRVRADDLQAFIDGLESQ